MYICTKYDKQQYNSYKTLYVTLYYPNYMASMLPIHPIHMNCYQRLTQVYTYKKRCWEFNIGQTTEKSLLNSPLHSWDGILKNFMSRDQIMNMLMPIVSKNMNTNPLFKSYMIIFEQTNKTNCMCILLETIVMMKILSPCT